MASEGAPNTAIRPWAVHLRLIDDRRTAGTSRTQVKKQIEGIDVPDVPEFLEMTTDAGGHLWACRMSADMMHLTDLYERVEGVMSAARFIELSEGAQTIIV